MTIKEKVARAIYIAWWHVIEGFGDGPFYRSNVNLWKNWLPVSDEAITAFLKAAAEPDGRGIRWHMRPDEATEEMGEAWAKLALDRIQKAVEGEMRTVGMVQGAKENYRAMLAAAPEFEVNSLIIKKNWRFVPEEPTEAMRRAGLENSGDEKMRTGGPEDAIDRMWRAMLDAAPEFEVEG